MSDKSAQVHNLTILTYQYIQQSDYELEISITHRNQEQTVELFQYTSASHSKLFLNPLQRNFEN